MFIKLPMPVLSMIWFQRSSQPQSGAGDAGKHRHGKFKWLGAYRPAGFAWMTQDLHPIGAVGDGTLAKADKVRRR